MGAEITEEKDVMSGPEAEEFIEELKKVFSIVRLLDKDNFEHMERHYNEHGEVPCQCYEIWKKKSPCENCISTKTFADGKQRTKLEFIDSKIYQVISRYIEIDGKPYVMELVSQLDENSLVDADGRNRLLKKLAGYNKELYTDVLTGTYNRRYYEEQLKMMREAAGVAMIDLDDFKMYNDTYGHKAGDRVLDTTVQIIRSCIRKSDIQVRYGGDEFLLILPDIEEKNFVERLKKIQEEIEPDLLLIDFVRKHGCKSVKRGCETSGCGLCTVFLDDKPVLSCSILAARVDGHKVTTLEGLKEEAEEFGAFIADQGAEQCGFCNPGMIMNALALFRENEFPNEEEIKEYLAGNLCRCSGYEGQLRGIQNFLVWKKEKRGEEVSCKL